MLKWPAFVVPGRNGPPILVGHRRTSPRPEGSPPRQVGVEEPPGYVDEYVDYLEILENLPKVLNIPTLSGRLVVEVHESSPFLRGSSAFGLFVPSLLASQGPQPLAPLALVLL